MSYAPWNLNSNKTPFTDICVLISEETATDAEGCRVSVGQSRREVFCSLSAGVARTEYYEAYKAGIKASVTVELWEDEFNGAEVLEHGGKRYKIGRAYPTGHGTLQLTCAEVKR